VSRILPRVLAALLGAPLLLAGVPPQSSLRVLFIGNSLTAANDLPGMVRAIAETAGSPRIVTSAVTRPGFSLEDHWHAGEARAAIARRTWDVVVLQQGPSALPESQVLLREYARRFDADIRRAGAATALYMVWPSKARFSDFDGVSASYRRAARDVDGLLLPAGDAWRAAWRRDPDLALYDSDRFHPSRLGTWLAALVVYESLSGRSVVKLPSSLRGTELTPELARLLQEAAHEAVATVR
jgi:hypothetical protein